VSYAHTTESVIELAAQLKAEASKLYDAYMLSPQLIEKEHRAIKAGDINAVQAVGDEKAAAAELVEAAFHAMNLVSEQIARAEAAVFDTPRRRLTTLKEAIAALEAIAAHLATDPDAQAAGLSALGVQVLRHQLGGLAQVQKAFDEKIPAVKPMIEANKHLLQLMLESYQESYRFWQQVAEETTASYNAQGLQKAAGRNSGFRAKA
jgi:hypothetical protein